MEPLSTPAPVSEGDLSSTDHPTPVGAQGRQEVGATPPSPADRSSSQFGTSRPPENLPKGDNSLERLPSEETVRSQRDARVAVHGTPASNNACRPRGRPNARGLGPGSDNISALATTALSFATTALATSITTTIASTPIATTVPSTTVPSAAVATAVVYH